MQIINAIRIKHTRSRYVAAPEAAIVLIAGVECVGVGQRLDSGERDCDKYIILLRRD